MRAPVLRDSNTYGYDPRLYLGGRQGRRCAGPACLRSAAGVELTERGENGRGIPHRENGRSRARPSS